VGPTPWSAADAPIGHPALDPRSTNHTASAPESIGYAKIRSTAVRAPAHPCALPDWPRSGTFDPVKLAYIRWKDAVAEEASAAVSPAAQAKLVDLQEVGFLLDENEEAVVIGMELSDDAEVAPGRWRLHIPRVSIQEMRVVELEKAFSRRRKSRG